MELIMAKKVGNEDSDLEFLMDEVAPIIQKTKTYQKEKTDMNKEQYNKAKADHNEAIAKYKLAIKKHKLLKKQAKIAYKLGAMKES
jgi:hypothetical protein